MQPYDNLEHVMFIFPEISIWNVCILLPTVKTPNYYQYFCVFFKFVIVMQICDHFPFSLPFASSDL